MFADFQVAGVGGSETWKSHLEQTVELHHDYFTAQFLLAFPFAGIYEMHVETSLIDADDALWNTGPQLSYTVKATDEASGSNRPQTAVPVLPASQKPAPKI